MLLGQTKAHGFPSKHKPKSVRLTTLKYISNNYCSTCLNDSCSSSRQLYVTFIHLLPVNYDFIYMHMKHQDRGIVTITTLMLCKIKWYLVCVVSQACCFEDGVTASDFESPAKS